MDVKIVAVYEIIKLTESKVIYLGTFKCAATRSESGYVIASCFCYGTTIMLGGGQPLNPDHTRKSNFLHPI